MNLGLHVGLTSSLWSLRQITPLRKTGPSIVRKTSSLRPISLASDMASVQDALWLGRCALRLQLYCGPGQQGGVGDPGSVVLALVSHAQVRDFQGLDTYWAMADLKWAFDTADVSAMLLCAYWAGITGIEWLLLDDFLRSDRQRVALHGFCSDTFRLGRGTAQGRRFSVLVFNGMLRLLVGELDAAGLSSCSTWLPPFARKTIAAAASIRQPLPSCLGPTHAPFMRHIADRAMTMASCEEAPWPLTVAFLVDTLAALPLLADRVAVLERLGTAFLCPLQLVDDITVACASPGAARSVCSQGPDSACSRYAKAVRAEFNYKPSKTAVMAMADSAPVTPAMVGCDVVKQRRLLGFLIDSGLTFKPLLAETLRRGAALFSHFFYAAETAGFSIPVAAAQVPLRIEPALLFAAPLLAVVPRAESALNKLQYGWGMKLLGCAPGPRLRWLIVVAQCGWEFRLGTRMIEKAILARARLFVLPPDHPAVVVFEVARASLAPCWVNTVSALMNRECWANPIPDMQRSYLVFLRLLVPALRLDGRS